MVDDGGGVDGGGGGNEENSSVAMSMGEGSGMFCLNTLATTTAMSL